MTTGFYEQLGVDPRASAGAIRDAYSRAVSRLVHRRRAVSEQGGDTAQLDLAREQLEEAWSVVSDPVRRRRYDAMLSWSEADRPKTADALWEEVSDALVHPAAALAVKLLRIATRLGDIGQLPIAPSAEHQPPTLVPNEDDLTQPHGRTAHLTDTGEAPVADVVVLPGTSPVRAVPEQPLRVVDGSPSASPVVVLPTERPATQLTAAQVAALVASHGYGGSLLQAVREGRGQSLQDLSDTTRISVKYLEAVEREDRSSLPSATFVRGYVRELARVLELDVDAVLAGYMARFED